MTTSEKYTISGATVIVLIVVFLALKKHQPIPAAVTTPDNSGDVTFQSPGTVPYLTYNIPPVNLPGAPAPIQRLQPQSAGAGPSIGCGCTDNCGDGLNNSLGLYSSLDQYNVSDSFLQNMIENFNSVFG